MTYLPELRALAISLTGDNARADDLVQDTIEKAWGRIDGFTPGTNMWGWLFTILRNTLFSQNRRAWREVPRGGSEIGAGLCVPPAHDGRLALADIRAALLELPPGQREAVLLVGALGYSYDEASRLSGVRAGTIKSRTNRARAHLARAMGISNGGCIAETDGMMRAAGEETRAF